MIIYWIERGIPFGTFLVKTHITTLIRTVWNADT
jgi:hypothetical protein